MFRRWHWLILVPILLAFPSRGLGQLVPIPADPSGTRGSATLCPNLAGTAWVPCSVANPLPTSIAGSAVAADVNVQKWGGSNTTLGQKPMATSVPVAIASDQPPLSVAVSGTIALSAPVEISNLPPSVTTAAGLAFFTTGPTNNENMAAGPIWLSDYTALAIQADPWIGGVGVWISTDRGRSWGLLTGVSTSQEAEAVAAYGNIVVFTGRDRPFAADDKIVWRSGDGGYTWGQITIGGAFGASVGCAIGLKSTGTGILFTEKGTYRSTNYGASWARVDASSVCSSGDKGKIVSPTTNVWIGVAGMGGSNSAVRYSADDGQTWATALAGDAAAITAGDLSCASATECYMVRGPTATRDIWKSTNSGQTWASNFQMPAAATGGPVGILGVTSNILLVFANYGAGVLHVWRSLDAGTSWQDQGAMPTVTTGGASAILHPAINSFGDIIVQTFNPAGGQPELYYSPTLQSNQFVLSSINGLPLGTSSNPIRNDPTGTTTQPASQASGGGGATNATRPWATVPIQADTLFNSQTTGAANTAVVVTIAAAASTRAHLYRTHAYCSAGTSQLTVQDGASTIWATTATEIGTTRFESRWNPGLTGTTNTAMTITLSTCGVGNTGTLSVQSDRF